MAATSPPGRSDVRAVTATASPARPGEQLLSVRDITKTYGANVALRPTSFDLAAGDCVAIIGENGAGKSTFAKVLTGTEIPDAGEIHIAGERVSFHSPRNALSRGVALIPQELAHVPGLTVAENLLLNRLPGRGGLTSRARIRDAAAALMERLGMWVDPDARMSDLGVSDQQVVELVKALGRDSRLLVLDEPTAALTEDEADTLYSILDAQRSQGIGVIVISHHLDQISRFASRIDVFRDGERVFAASPRDTDKSVFIQQMLGTSAMPAAAERPHRSAGAAVLSVQNWRAPGRPGLAGVSFDLREREVLGVYGIRGSGSELIAAGLGGRCADLGGTIALQGSPARPVPSSPRAALRAGIGYVPPDRKRDGLVPGQPVRTAISFLVLGRLATCGVLRARSETRVAGPYAERFRLRATGLEQPVGQLSGGNQQKVLLAGRIAAAPDVLVVHEPTRGVDIGARHEIHETLRDLTDDGVGVLVVTSDVEEAVEVSDRLLIVRDGQIVAELLGEDITQDNAVHLAAA